MPSAAQWCRDFSAFTLALVMSPKTPVRYFVFICKAVCRAFTATPLSPLRTVVQVNFVMPERTGTVMTCPTRIVVVRSLLAEVIALTVERHRVAILLSESPLRTVYFIADGSERPAT